MPGSSARPKAVLFDFDGTLARLTLNFGRMRRVAVEALEKTLGTLPEFEHRESLPTMELVAAVTAALPPDQAEAARAAASAAIARYELEAAAASALFPFTRPMLARLRSLGVKTAVITRNCREAVAMVFPDHQDYCDLVLTRDDVEQVKPHPEHLLAAVRSFGVSPAETLMVGDHPMDIQSAHNAGCLGAGVLGGEADRDRLEAAAPDFLAGNAGDLMGAIFPAIFKQIP